MAVDVEPTAPPADTEPAVADEAGPAQPSARPRWSAKRMALALGALAALGGVLVLGVGSSEEPASEEPASDEPADDLVPSLSGQLEDGFVVFTDPETGISLQHPESWVPLREAEGELRLVLGAGGNSSFMVRSVPLNGISAVDTPEELVEVQAVTDRIAGADGVQVVNREAVELNGMLGIAYLARFTDEASGTKVANAQYFLFEGDTMHVLLFQAAPEEDFERLAPVFDKVLASFQAGSVESAPEGEPSGG